MNLGRGILIIVITIGASYLFLEGEEKNSVVPETLLPIKSQYNKIELEKEHSEEPSTVSEESQKSKPSSKARSNKYNSVAVISITASEFKTYNYLFESPLEDYISLLFSGASASFEIQEAWVQEEQGSWVTLQGVRGEFFMNDWYRATGAPKSIRALKLVARAIDGPAELNVLKQNRY